MAAPEPAKPGTEGLLAKAKAPGEQALRLHRHYRGKIGTAPRCAVRSLADFSIWYTPGVAEPCRAIVRDPAAVFELTNKGNTVMVVSDGTRVLGLGDIGPQAGLPVMEGKCLLFKYLGGVDAVPICLDTKDPGEIVRIVKALHPSYGGVNLEDIASPKCFRILDDLRRELPIPVWHDDQQGTAAVTVAGLLNALNLAGKALSQAKIALIGAGAANVSVARLLFAAGADPARMRVCDSRGLLFKGRADFGPENTQKFELAQKTNAEQRTGGIAEAMAGADAVVALSKPGPGTIRKEWIRAMADDAIVFACANPTPEIWPWEAKEAGARIVATGRSDFLNQVNNSLGFPGIFRGTLDVRARAISDEMCLAAAYALARRAQALGLRENHILPAMDDPDTAVHVAVAVGAKAIEQGLAQAPRMPDELEASARQAIERAREETRILMEREVIPPLPAPI